MGIEEEEELITGFLVTKGGKNTDPHVSLLVDRDCTMKGSN